MSRRGRSDLYAQLWFRFDRERPTRPAAEINEFYKEMLKAIEAVGARHGIDIYTHALKPKESTTIWPDDFAG